MQTRTRTSASAANSHNSYTSEIRVNSSHSEISATQETQQDHLHNQQHKNEQKIQEAEISNVPPVPSELLGSVIVGGAGGSRRSRRLRGQGVGAMHGEGEVHNRSSRVGSAYQAVLEDFSEDAKSLYLSSAASIVNRMGRIVWDPNRCEEEVANEYLTKLSEMFQDQMMFSSERALYFLHALEYKVELAISHLQPRAVPSAVGLLPTEKNESDAPVPNVSEGNHPGHEAQFEDEIVSEDDDTCFQCKDGGELVICDFTGCSKVYHASCVGLSKLPPGKWYCPHHKCSSCSKNAPLRLQCMNCQTSYCEDHVPLSVQKDYPIPLFLCENCSIGIKDSIDIVSLFSGPIGKRQFNLHLGEFYKKRTHHQLKVPSVGGKKLDFYLLYKYVIHLKGWEEVSKRCLWDVIARLLDLPQTSRNLGRQVKQYYLYVLKNYEEE